jgi:hypothetical protein
MDRRRPPRPVEGQGSALEDRHTTGEAGAFYLDAGAWIDWMY